MQRVIGHGRIARRLVSPVPLKNRDPRKIAVGPMHATVGGSREADIRAATAENSSHLKGGHDGRTVGERTGLHFRGMLA